MINFTKNRQILGILGGFASFALVLVSVVSFTPAPVQAAVNCQLSGGGIVNFSQAGYLDSGNLVEGQGSTGGYGLTAGKYKIYLHAYDNHSVRPDQTQNNEHHNPNQLCEHQ